MMMLSQTLPEGRQKYASSHKSAIGVEIKQLENYYPANATLVCVLSDIKSLYLSIYLSRDRYLGVGDTDLCEIFSNNASPLLVAISLRITKCGVKKGLRVRVDHFWSLDTNFCHLTANIPKTLSCSGHQHHIMQLQQRLALQMLFSSLHL